MQKNEQTPLSPHHITLKDRKDLFLTGVNEVVSATESAINLKTSHGALTIMGSKLKIKNLNDTAKELTIDGEVSEIKYGGGKKRFLEKCFR